MSKQSRSVSIMGVAFNEPASFGLVALCLPACPHTQSPKAAGQKTESGQRERKGNCISSKRSSKASGERMSERKEESGGSTEVAAARPRAGPSAV
jgi:hypothetical protein